MSLILISFILLSGFIVPFRLIKLVRIIRNVARYLWFISWPGSLTFKLVYFFKMQFELTFGQRLMYWSNFSQLFFTLLESSVLVLFKFLHQSVRQYFLLHQRFELFVLVFIFNFFVFTHRFEWLCSFQDFLFSLLLGLLLLSFNIL